MAEEIFDIVNEHDEVIGQAPRREVHARGLWHRAIHVLVFNARGEVFLPKRSMLKDTARGKWDSSTSGHVDRGEDYDATAVRELREEIGLVVTQTPERLLKISSKAARSSLRTPPAFRSPTASRILARTNRPSRFLRDAK